MEIVIKLSFSISTFSLYWTFTGVIALLCLLILYYKDWLIATVGSPVDIIDLDKSIHCWLLLLHTHIAILPIMNRIGSWLLQIKHYVLAWVVKLYDWLGIVRKSFTNIILNILSLLLRLLIVVKIVDNNGIIPLSQLSLFFSLSLLRQRLR